MLTFIIGLVILIGGAALYGRFCEKVFGPDDRKTPAYTKEDGVDFVPMRGWKNSLINLLNIAGTGPILGPIQGILFGPIAFLTIPIGNVIGGAMHDYFSGMICLRDGGTQMPQMIKRYSNKGIFNVYNVFCCLLLLLVGAVFVYTPGDIAATSVFGFDGKPTSVSTWIIYGVIFLYYLVATVFPIDAIIGRIYPIFGAILLFSAVGVFIGIFVKGYPLLNVWDDWSSPILQLTGADGAVKSFTYADYFKGGHFLPIFFVTVACGILSGFHSTQSPLMARCMKSEKQGHFVFYGAMVCEGVIALIWAAAGCSLYEVTDGLNTGLAQALAMGQSKAIYDVCSKTMGGVGIALAMIGVVVCPITSGDTAFRSARLTLADWFKIDQDSYGNRLKLCIPVLGVGAFLGIGNALGFINYTVIWRYFSWTNQTLAMIVLWAASMYLFYDKKNYWITAVPATFMSAVSVTYFLLGNECLGQFLNTKTAEGATVYNTAVAYPVGIIVAIVFLGIFLYTIKKRNPQPHYETLHK
mgnify:CR=1 FL=1